MDSHHRSLCDCGGAPGYGLERVLSIPYNNERDLVVLVKLLPANE